MEEADGRMVGRGQNSAESSLVLGTDRDRDRDRDRDWDRDPKKTTKKKMEETTHLFETRHIFGWCGEDG